MSTRDLAQEARDLAAYKTVPAALPRRKGYRRVSTYWLSEVAGALEEIERQLAVAKRFAPDIVRCGACGNPRAEGIRCTYCPPAPPVPPAEEHPDWRIEVSWNEDLGWIVEEPREDDGEMEINDIVPDSWDNDRVLKKDAIQWGLDLARKRQLPLRIFHKRSTRITDIPLSEIL